MTNHNATGNILNFLNRSELGFGSSPDDLEAITNGKALRERVAHLPVQPPIQGCAAYAEQFRSSINLADWEVVAAEQKQRIRAVDTLQAGSVAQSYGVTTSSIE